MSTYENENPPKVLPAEVLPSPPPSRGCGCGACALGCFGAVVLAAIVAAAGVWYVWKKLPDWSRSALVAAVEQSDLPDEQKQRIVTQVDRVVGEYKAGRLTQKQFSGILQELTESPLMSLLVAFSASEKYIEPSGLAPEEKEEARIVLQRVARGVHEQRITPEQLDPALDYLSTKDANGNRQFADKVTDAELRAMLAECRQIADEAQVPPGPFTVDVAAAIEKAVDQALQQPKL